MSRRVILTWFGGLTAATAAAAALAAHSTAAAPAPSRVHGERVATRVWLASPAPSSAASYATAVSTPGNPLYRQFLTPDQYAARFGATPKEVSAVTAWLRSRGFTAIGTNAQRDYVSATGSATRVNGADTGAKPPTVPRTLAHAILGITTAASPDAGVRFGAQQSAALTASNPYPPIKPGSCSSYWGQHTASGLPDALGSTTFAEAPCPYTGEQLRTAYGADMTNTGKGQTIAIGLPGGLEPGMFQTLQDFAKENHLPAPSRSRYHEVSLKPASCKAHDTERGEEEMDIEAAYAMAPGATQVAVGGNVCDTADHSEQTAFDTELAIIDGNGMSPLATVVSTSDAYGYDNQAQSTDAIQNAVLVKAASVGVGMYWSAGDTPCVAQPASSPYATDVGGTTLALGKTGGRLFETGSGIGISLLKNGAWTTPKYFGLGGGQSLLYKQPAYQRGVVPSSVSQPPRAGEPAGQTGCRYGGGPEPAKSTTAMRTAPDVSATANNMRVGLLYRGRYVHIADAETSLAAPLVAGMVVAAQQGQPKPFGFINPALYKLAGTNAFYDPQPLTAQDPPSWRTVVCAESDSACSGVTALWRIDDESQALKGASGQVTRKGYDTVTGVGVPNGQAFIRALRALAPAAASTAPATAP